MFGVIRHPVKYMSYSVCFCTILAQVSIPSSFVNVSVRWYSPSCKLHIIIAFVSSILANVSIPGYYVFVGGEDMTEKGRFRWINGEPVNGIPWHSGRPVGRDGQRCLTMSIHYSFTFYDVQCTDVYTDVFTFLCQKK